MKTRHLLLGGILLAVCLAAGPAHAQGPARGCVETKLTWPQNERSIPVCWETHTRPPDNPKKRMCQCGDGTQTEAPCMLPICEHVCRAHGGMACSPIQAPKPEVCTGLSEAECNRLRELVRQAIRDTWESVSLVRFVGWGQCSRAPTLATSDNPCPGTLEDGLQGIRIEVKSGRGASCLGTSGDNVSGGMHFQFGGGRSDDQIRATAIHEFGHALGFAHEQARPDTPDWCQDRDTGNESTGCSAVGTWDASSVMNYCRPGANGSATTLSATDIATVQGSYGGGTVASCAAGLTQCGADCVNTKSDGSNCGACGTACPANNACVKGSCVSCVCPANSCARTACGNSCTCGDWQNCGTTKTCSACGENAQACCANGSACRGNLTCNGGGTCSCAAGLAYCGSSCVMLGTNGNCSRCGDACGNGRKCVKRHCQDNPDCETNCADANTACVEACQSGGHGGDACIERCKTDLLNCLQKC